MRPVTKFITFDHHLYQQNGQACNVKLKRRRKEDYFEKYSIEKDNEKSMVCHPCKRKHEQTPK
jgi:hypothetical protein